MKGRSIKYISIRRPELSDVPKLNEFFRVVITDTFLKEGIGGLVDDLEEEINTKNHYLNQDIRNNGEERYFLIALNGEAVVGTIEFGPSSELIRKCINDSFKGLPEVGTVFVHPSYQRQGIGNLLLEKMYLTLNKKGIEEFYLDSGYQFSQKIWQNKFGEPDLVLKDYWGIGAHHMIWKVKLCRGEG